MKKTILTLMLSLSIILPSFASADKLKGRLIDEDNNPVEFAAVIIKSLSSDAVVGTAITTSDGEFCFDIPEGTYSLEASLIGYQSMTIKCGIQDLGDLTFAKDIQTLAAATTSASRTVKKAEKFIIVPDPTEVKASSKGLDLLSMQQLPGLKVDRGLKSITVEGGTPVYKINGKEVQATRLMNLNPDNIKRIEYSNTPGIQYLDRGATGIINIVLKEPEDGGSLSVDLSGAVNTWFDDAYILGSYHKGKSEIALEAYGTHRNYHKGDAQMTESYKSDERAIDRNTIADSPLGYTRSQYTLEYTYQPSDSTMFVASLSDNIMFNSYSKRIGTISETENGISSIYNYNTGRENHGNDPRLDLFFSKDMKNDQRLELNVVGQSSFTDMNANSTYSKEDYEEFIEQSFKNNGWALSGEAAYNRMLGKVESRVGVQYLHNQATNKYRVNDLVSKMTKDNTYGYVQFKGSAADKFNWSIGTGVKVMNVNDGTDSKTFIRNLSSIRLDYKLSDKWNATAESSLSPVLPSLSQLAPVLQITDRIEGVQGNPSLVPSNQTYSKIKLRYSSGNGFYGELVGGYNYCFNPIFESYSYNKDLGLFIQSTDNGKEDSRAYLQYEFGVKKLFDHFNISTDGLWKREHSESDNFSHTLCNYSADINFQAVWEKVIVGGLFTVSPHWTLMGELIGSSEKNQMLYFQYNLKNLSLSATWHCPFNKKGYYYCTKGLSDMHQFVGENWTVENGNMIVLNLTWNFSFGKKFNKGNKTLWNGGYDNGVVS